MCLLRSLHHRFSPHPLVKLVCGEVKNHYLPQALSAWLLFTPR
jgi:hypothetical protein